MREPLAEPAAEAKPPASPGAVPELRYLRRLVTGLAVVMGLGIIAIVALLWVRLTPAAPTLPEGLHLPPGARPAAVTVARDWAIVVTEAGEVLVFDATGALRQTVTLPAD